MVKEKRALWDYRCEEYKLVEQKNATWESIARELSITDGENSYALFICFAFAMSVIIIIIHIFGLEIGNFSSSPKNVIGDPRA